MEGVSSPAAKLQANFPQSDYLVKTSAYLANAAHKAEDLDTAIAMYQMMIGQPLLFDRKMVVSAPVWLVIDRFTKRGMVQPSAVSSRSGWRRVRWKRSSRRLNWRENVRTKLSKLGRFQSLFLKRHAIQQSKPRNSTRWCVGACIGAALVR